MGHRSEIRLQRKTDSAATKIVNVVLKRKERARREARMVQKLKEGSLPYAPSVMSWLSRQLGKPAGRVTAEEVRTLIG